MTRVSGAEVFLTEALTPEILVLWESYLQPYRLLYRPMAYLGHHALDGAAYSACC